MSNFVTAAELKDLLASDLPVRVIDVRKRPLQAGLSPELLDAIDAEGCARAGTPAGPTRGRSPRSG